MVPCGNAGVVAPSRRLSAQGLDNEVQAELAVFDDGPRRWQRRLGADTALTAIPESLDEKNLKSDQRARGFRSSCHRALPDFEHQSPIRQADVLRMAMAWPATRRRVVQGRICGITLRISCWAA
jgi:hypothetical protein